MRLDQDYPLEAGWNELRLRLEQTPLTAPSGLTTGVYLDIAEKIVRGLVPFLDRDGVLREPYEPYDELFGTSRLAGALGQLIQAGRCHDLEEICCRAVERCFDRWEDPKLSPEFWMKETLYAWEALSEGLPAKRRRAWEDAWRGFKPFVSYNALANDKRNNWTAFVMLGEFLRFKHGFADDLGIVERILDQQLGLDLFSAHGLYMDPYCPVTYALVVCQQWDALLHWGYDGPFADQIGEMARRAGLTCLLMQSTTGQAPFGGRSNQFHFNEGHQACFFETRAAACQRNGDSVMAGAFRRAALKAAECVKPWVLDTDRPNYTLKHGFDPSRKHGTDSGGTFTVYSALAASLFATAHGLSTRAVEEGPAPTDVGGYVFDTGPEFHKVFAACRGYHLEIDTCADTADGARKDATGLGRFQRAGFRSDAGVSGSIAARPDYTIADGVGPPDKWLAVGPEWTASDGTPERLAAMGDRVRDVRLEVECASPDKAAFTVCYRGDFGAAESILERYVINEGGLRYGVDIRGEARDIRILIPMLESDGSEKSVIETSERRLTVAWHGTFFHVVPSVPLEVSTLDGTPLANRNGLYVTGCVPGCEVRLQLTTQSRPGADPEVKK